MPGYFERRVPFSPMHTQSVRLRLRPPHGVRSLSTSKQQAGRAAALRREQSQPPAAKQSDRVESMEISASTSMSIYSREFERKASEDHGVGTRTTLARNRTRQLSLPAVAVRLGRYAAAGLSGGTLIVFGGGVDATLNLFEDVYATAALGLNGNGEFILQRALWLDGRGAGISLGGFVRRERQSFDRDGNDPFSNLLVGLRLGGQAAYEAHTVRAFGSVGVDGRYDTVVVLLGFSLGIPSRPPERSGPAPDDFW